MINITLPDGSIRQYEAGITPMDVALSISEGLARNVLIADINGQSVDLNTSINADVNLKLYTWNDKEGKNTFWHSSAHLMAEALETIYPGIKFWVGPALENGFYYDVDTNGEPISSDDFKKIEDKMLELARQKSEFQRIPISKTDALKYFNDKGDEYKLDLLQNLEDGNITLYKQGNFTDLCRGPHIPNTGFIKAVKLTNAAAAYFKGDQNNKMLTRVYGISFPKAKELEEYVTMIEEAKRRDHRKLGAELDLFTFSEKVGKGLPLWLPKGAMLRERLENFLKRAQLRSGYLPVVTPHIGSKALYVTSGHWEKYGADSFQPIKTPEEGEEFMLKPMNCPHHCEIFNSRPRSYKELPLRLAEFGTVYRYEQSGELHGLTRVRGFTQDDAHIFCANDQVESEFKKVIDLVLYVFTSLGFDDFSAQISLRSQDDRSKYIGTDADWDKAEAAIINAAADKGLNTVIEYGEAAFYGPKLDFMVKDALGRKWQLGTIQVDYQLPNRFQLEYTGADNQKHRPVMIHRAPFGSMERFIAILIENTAGNFPFWLSPEQIAILPISEKYEDFANEVFLILQENDVRGYVDHRAEKIGKKIRDAEVNKVPMMLIIGEKEAEEGKISLRRKGEGDLGTMTIDEFLQYAKNEINKNIPKFSNN